MSLIEKLKSDLEGFKGVGFEDVGEFVKVTVPYEPGKEGKDRWIAIDKIVKQYGGEWISNKKWSHWKVPKTVASESDLSLDKYREAVREIKKILRDLE